MDEEEKAILEEEREAVIVESWRFLDEHAMECKRHSAALLEEIAQQLRCVKHEKDDKGEVTVVDKAAMVFLESEERAVVGSLRLSECHVQDFDLSIRFPRYNKGASAHYTIAPKTSYLLRQIQVPRREPYACSDGPWSTDRGYALDRTLSTLWSVLRTSFANCRGRKQDQAPRTAPQRMATPMEG